LISLLGVVVIVFAGALLVTWTVDLKQKVLTQSLIVAILISAFIGYSASGALITEAMSAVGTSPWKFTTAIAIQLGLGAFLAIYVPRLFKRS
jgi:hypothetical protein